MRRLRARLDRVEARFRSATPPAADIFPYDLSKLSFDELLRLESYALIVQQQGADALTAEQIDDSAELHARAAISLPAPATSWPCSPTSGPG